MKVVHEGYMHWLLFFFFLLQFFLYLQSVSDNNLCFPQSVSGILLNANIKLPSAMNLNGNYVDCCY